MAGHSSPWRPLVAERVLPWRTGALAGWEIMTMCHVRPPKAGDPFYLYVALQKGGEWINHEGPDDAALWDELERQARETDSAAG